MSHTQALYVINDALHPAAPEVIARTRAEEAFSEGYLNRTGVMWRHHFGHDGPRPPPVLNMWPAKSVGTIHRVLSEHGFWCVMYFEKKIYDNVIGGATGIAKGPTPHARVLSLSSSIWSAYPLPPELSSWRTF
jgi:hypothetical protein